MSLAADARAVAARIARVSPRLRRYADKGLSARLKRKIERAVKRKGLMETIMARRFSFGARQGPGSQKWKPLTPGYLRWKLRHGYSPTPNNRTYALLQAAERAVAGSWRFDAPVRWAGVVSSKARGSVRYAGYVNAVRPYDLNPSRRELEPTVRFALREIEKELRAIARGG